MVTRLIAVTILIATTASYTVHAGTPGITETEIKVGATFPFSGPASSLSNVGKGLIAYVISINDRGGVNGRRST